MVNSCNTQTRTLCLVFGVAVVVILAVGLSQFQQDGSIVLTLSQRAAPPYSSKSSLRSKRVIGGTEIVDGEWPWLVNIRGHIPTMYFFWWAVQHVDIYCAGSILNNRWILTSAHCFRVPGLPKRRMSTAANWYIKAGDVQLSFSLAERLCGLWDKIQQTENSHCWYLRVSDVILHPNYSAPDTWKNDIALLKLSNVLDFGSNGLPSNIAPVQLPTSTADSWPPPGSNCSFQGWGCTVLGGPLAQYANEVILPALNDSVCDSPPAPYDYNEISPTRICAGYNLNDKGLCKGDSGGPLVCRNGSAWVQAGIASFTSAYNPGDVPGVFTRVTAYTDWINSIIAKK